MAKALYGTSDRKRLVPTPKSLDANEPYRTPWRRDYARLIHSPAFRRLQGKTQLFPAHESDFFRNRLTHSLEVAQIAKSIAIKLNNTHQFFKDRPIEPDIVETAALAHDLGHPPFGHNGEEALDECMIDSGGFEGNAQTLRILTKLEKRETGQSSGNVPIIIGTDGRDQRAGLNLTFRTLAAILKYPQQIPLKKEYRPVGHDGPLKGYYESENAIVSTIMKNIGYRDKARFRTVECCIMDVADDIAYSTYDLEDSFKGGFMTPLSILGSPTELAESVAARIVGRLNKYYGDRPANERNFTVADVYRMILFSFESVYEYEDKKIFNKVADGKLRDSEAVAAIATYIAGISEKTAASGYYRTRHTSDLIGRFIQEGIEVIEDEEFPALSTVRLNIDTFKQVEVLKNLAYQSIIMSPMLKVTEYRGKDIVTRIFTALDEPNGCHLMPDDFREVHENIRAEEKKRVICDFIAGMTDRYAIEFYRRLYGMNSETIYSPL